MKFVCGLVAFFLSTLLAVGLPQYLAQFAVDPLSAPDLRERCGTCHVNPSGGGERNEFGLAFAAAGHTITVDLRGRFPGIFRYRTQVVDPQTEIRYADPSGKTAVLKKDAQYVLIDPSAGSTGGASPAAPPAATGTASSRRATVNWPALMPEGKGRQETEVACSSCHDLKFIVTERRADAAGWTVTIERMIYAHDAFVLEEEIPVIAEYLAAHFGPRTPPLQYPIRINSVGAEVLRSLPGITADEAAAIVASRSQGGISDSGRLEAILGKERTERIRSLVSFEK